MFLSLILAITLEPAPAPEPVAPEPVVISAPLLPAITPPVESAPAPASPSAPPPRWLFMRELQGTAPGWLLDGNRLSISGWTEIAFTGSSAESNNLPEGFNYRANKFSLQQNWLRFERPVVTTGTTEPTFGFRFDTILPGVDYRFTLARGLFDRQLTANNGEPNTYGIDPIQFYGEAYFPTVGRGLDVKVGRFFAQFGVESNDAVSNILASHSYTFIYDPFTQTGVLTTWTLTDAWSVQAGAVLGSDIFIDPADKPTAIGSIKWAPPNGRDSVLLSFVAGPGRFDTRHNFNNPSILDLVYTHQFSTRVNETFEALAGYQDGVPGIGSAHWFGAVNYLTYTLSPRLSVTSRLECFDDAQGQRTGFEGVYTAITAGLSFRPRPAITFRPELRYDYNGQSRPYEGRHGLLTAAADVILRW
jgi:hypothetical protein